MALRKTPTAPLHAVQPRAHARDLPGLQQQLADPDPRHRRLAARDLAAFPQAALALGRALAVETDASVREALFNSLGQLSSDEAVQALLPLLRTEDAGLRNGAIEALAAMPQVVAPCMDRLLLDPDADVRIFAVNLLGELRHANVPRWLQQVLRHEAHVNVVAASLEVLAEVGSTADLPALVSVRERFGSDAFIQFAADVAISRIETS
ncbi:HEAT repeat domain-containing protein [Roseateles sp. BYS87W]|uniref:HEAT repeat domain-containing protein n=1 Tax=Pelomonas baiyunensis TaxID=3299026 RepID=A0ABW7GYF3_9BURK